MTDGGTEGDVTLIEQWDRDGIRYRVEKAERAEAGLAKARAKIAQLEQQLSQARSAGQQR